MAIMSRLPTWTFGIQPRDGDSIDLLADAIAGTYGGVIRQFDGQDLPELTGDGWAVKFDDATDDPFGGCNFLVDVLAADATSAHDIAAAIVQLLTVDGWTCVMDDPEFDNPPLDQRATRAAS